MSTAESDISRILSLDGAGIYGLTAARWLQQMSERSQTFLSKRQVDLFAGTSSGAINALLLARKERPRDGIADCVALWHAAEPWQNVRNPVDAVLSFAGLTPWYGTEDFRSYLDALFGDVTLGELPHKVLVCGYDLHGEHTGAGARPSPDSPFHTPTSGQRRTGVRMVDDLLAGVLRGDNGDDERHWEPVVITNFLEGAQTDMKVADLAYSATAVPGLRAVINGIADAGAFNASPSTLAMAAAVEHARAERPDVDPFEVTRTVLASLSMLSVGDGTFQPFYWLDRFNFGTLPYTLLPVNPSQGPWPPSSYSLQAPAQMSDRVVATMLGPGKYFRLNPGVISFPTANTVVAARFGLMRRIFVHLVEQGVLSPASVQAVDQAVDFIDSSYWIRMAKIVPRGRGKGSKQEDDHA